MYPPLKREYRVPFDPNMNEFPTNSKSEGNHMQISHVLICRLNSPNLKDFQVILHLVSLFRISREVPVVSLCNVP